MEKLELKGGIDVAVKASSNQFSLSNRDLWLGLLMAALAPVALQLYELLMAFLSDEVVVFNWKSLAKTGIASGAAYLGKNFLDKGKIVIEKDAIKEAKK